IGSTGDSAAKGRSASRHGSLARCVQCRAAVKPGLGISVMIASMLAESVAVAGTPMPATATVTSLVAAARRPSKAVRSMFRSSYEPPKDPAHDVLYEELKTKQMLEKLSDALTAIRLKAPLWMKFAGCEGISNAWYEAYDGAITFCYEYVAELEQGARDAPA